MLMGQWYQLWHKKFWEELITYFPCTTYGVPDTTRNTYKTLYITVLLLLHWVSEAMFTKPLPRNVTREHRDSKVIS
jgi:hypothetical protein